MSKIKVIPFWEEVKPRGQYVYIHRRLSDNIVFYIGKGKLKRAWHRDTKSRNTYWLNVARKHGVSVEIIKDCMSHECALTLEKILISIFGKDRLCNLTDGGEGNNGYVTPPEVRMKQSLAKKGKKRGAMPEYVKAKISKSHIGIRPSAETLVKLRESHIGQRMGSENNKFDPIIRIFRHVDHGEFIGVQYDLRKKYDLPSSCLTSVVNGNQRSVKGWTYHGTCDKPFEYVYKGGKNGRD